MKLPLLILCLLPFMLLAQSKKQKKLLAAQLKEDQKVVNTIAGHYLTMSQFQLQDSLISYIESHLTVAGVHPLQSNSLIESIEKNEGKVVEQSTYLTVNGKPLSLYSEYIPMPFSAELKVTGMPAIALREKKQPWFIDYKTLHTGSANDAEAMHKIIKEANRAAAKGATALFLYNGTEETIIQYNAKDTNSKVTIPVIYITPAASKQYFSDASEIVDIDLNVALVNKIYSEKFIVGFINNQSLKTIIIQTQLPRVQPNIADSTSYNPVNIALILQLVNMLKNEKYNAYNYMVQIVHGENAYTSQTNKPIDYALILKNCSLSDRDSSMFLYGKPSSESWKEILPQLTAGNIQLVVDTTNHFYNTLSGYGGINYPYLLFSTKQSKVSFQTLLYVDLIKYILRTIEKTAILPQVVYTSVVPKYKDSILNATVTKIQDTTLKSNVVIPKIKVSLGIVTDKTYTGEGLKIKSVIPKKTAAQIGLQPGDILTHFGNTRIQNFKSYLQLISVYNPGDKVVLQFLRGESIEKINVDF